MSTLSPNMSLPVSTIGTDVGLAWETNLNASLSILDGHNHTAGYGVQIPPAGLNINSDLTFNSNSAIALKSTVFAPVASLSTLTAAYVIGPDFYFNDGNGNVVKLTQGGAVNATSSGISSGTATASFNAGVLVVNAASLTPANIQCASIKMGNNVASSHYLTLSPPSAMASDTAITLPVVPAAQSFMAIDSSGNMSAFAATSGGITGAMVAANTIQRTNIVATGEQFGNLGSSTVSITSSTFVSVSGLTVTLTTQQNPVILFLESDGSAVNPSTGIILTNTTGSSIGSAFVDLMVLGSGANSNYTRLTAFNLVNNGSCFFPASSFMMIDPASAGTYTYQIQARVSGSGSGITAAFNRMELVAYEL